MTAEVLQFKQKPVKGTQPRPTAKERFFCKSCCDDRFYVNTDGTLACFHCGCHIMNLKAILLR